MSHQASDRCTRRSFLSAVTGTALTVGALPLGCAASGSSVDQGPRKPAAYEPPLPPGAAIVAQGGRVLLPVVVRPAAGPASKAAAQTLAQYLSKISGAQFDVVADGRPSGVLVGLWSDFPELASEAGLAARFQGNEPAVLQTYLLRTAPERILLVGASDLAVEFAVWDFLNRLGYRQYFPGPKWEVVPSLEKVGLLADSLETPSFYDRRIWDNFGGDLPAKKEWDTRNRMLVHGSDTEINNDEGYGGFLGSNQPLFKEHPEYLALYKGARTSTKLCLSNADLRKLMVAFAIDHFVKKPAPWAISMNPPDGPGWCECGPCVAMGQPSNRLVTLANEVAEGLAPRFPDKRVGILAYYQHADPPTIAVHPRVVVDVATGFIMTKLPITQLVPAWAAKAPSIGIYDYYALFQWHKSMPAKSQAGNLPYLMESIPRFYAQNARAFVGEAGESWGACGPGFYVAARLLWNVHDDANAHVEDFLGRAFGEAKEAMRRFYAAIGPDQGRPGNAAFYMEKVTLMYVALGEARGLTKDPAVLARIDDLVMYARYVELYAQTQMATAATLPAAIMEFATHAYRIKDSHMIHWNAFRASYPQANQVMKEASVTAYGPNDARDLLAKGVQMAKARQAAPRADAGAAK